MSICEEKAGSRKTQPRRVQLHSKKSGSRSVLSCKINDEETNAKQAINAEREKEAQRAVDTSRRGGGGGGGRMGLGRGDARNFSGGGQNMPPPDYQRNTVGMDDLRRLGNRGGSRQPSSQGAPSFGPTSMFSARGSNTRRTLGPGGGLVPGGGGESGTSSRTATPPAQREKKEREEKEAATSANAFR